jgi:hypothetical protein
MHMRIRPALGSGLLPPPDPDGWFHTTIRVEAGTAKVFVDRSGVAQPPR